MAYDNSRQSLYNSMRNKFSNDADCWAWVNSCVFSQGEIRLETLLAANLTQFKFGLLQTDANSANQRFNTERRLNLQDSLVVSSYGIYVSQPSSNEDTTYSLITYGKSSLIPAADQASFNGLFNNGWLSISCDNYQLIPYRGMFNHLYQPQTQQTAALGAGSPADQLRGAEDGQITQEPNLVLNGAKQYNITVNVPVALASVTNPYSRIHIIFRGLLAQNSTAIN